MSTRISVPEITIGDHISVIKRENKIKKSEYLEKGLIPVIDQGQDFIAGYIDDEARAYDGPLPVIVFGDHTCTKKFIDFRFAVGADGTQLLRPKNPKEIDVRYLYYALLYVPLEQFGYQRHFKYLKDAKIPLPDLNYQRKIAAILSAYDNLIDNNLRRIKIQEEMAQTLYREWFVKFCFPGHQKAKMVNSPLGKIPEGWEVTPLNNLCIRITDGSHSSPKSVEMGYPMASVKDMRDWALDEDSCRRIAESDYHILVRNDCKPLVNDVLIAKDGSYLKHAFVVEEEKELVILSSIAILRPNVEQIFPHILCMYLRQPEVRSRLSGYVSGVALPRIILKDFAKFLAVKPEMPLQTQFMMAVEPFVRLIHVLIKKNSTLRRTRDLLLPKLISGKLDVSELDITIPEANA